MRAAFCTGKQQIEVRDAPDPRPNPGEALVRVRAAGICGSDLHLYNGSFPPMPNVSPGHEFAGEIAALGEGVTGWAEGDRVVVEPIVSCRACSYCRFGRYQLCQKHVLLGTFKSGGMAEYVPVPAYGLYRVPDSLDFHTAALTEPLAVAVHGLHLVDLKAGEKVLILGSGTIGVMSTLAASAAGCSVVTTYRYDHQGEAALAAGADRIVRDGETAGLESEGFDVVVETIGGTASTLGQALGIVRKGGRVCVLGLFTQSSPINSLGLILKETRVAGGIEYCTPGLRSDFDVALGILDRHSDRTRAFVTHRFPLTETAAAFATAADKTSKSLKVHLAPGA
jgi:NADPH2:quinone reductase